MPCRSDYMEPNDKERAAAASTRKAFESLGNRATHGADVLREYLLGQGTVDSILKYVNLPLEDEYILLRKYDDASYVKVDAAFRAHLNVLVEDYIFYNDMVTVTGRDNLSSDQLDEVRQAQIKHREQDLSRLMKTFAEAGDRLRMRAVLHADSAFPLAPQLGFDPDDF